MEFYVLSILDKDLGILDNYENIYPDEGIPVFNNINKVEEYGKICYFYPKAENLIPNILNNRCIHVRLIILKNKLELSMFLPQYILDILYKFKTKETVYENYIIIDIKTMTNNKEIKYLNLINKIIHKGNYRMDRTGTGTYSINTSSTLKFRLYDPLHGYILPVLTTKKVFTKGVIIELLWFLRASTNTDYLKENGVKIWDGNSTREFLDKQGLTDYREGELGTPYGWHWRNYGAKYIPEKFRTPDMMTEKGIDQLQEAINMIRNDPSSRRIIVSAWNPIQLKDTPLVACHYGFQFTIDFKDNKPSELNIIVHMRSADIGLGVPFNIMSYSLLLYMISYLTGLRPNCVSIEMADCHIYTNHMDQLKLQITRNVKNFPKFKFSENIFKNVKTIDDFAYKTDINDYIIEEYNPHPPIIMKMAV